jgi:hypothetical protein
VGGTVYYWDHQFTSFSIPRLTVSPATGPGDPATDNLLEVTWSVTEAQGHGSGYLNSMYYRELFTPGDVDFFIADSANYGSFTSGSAFEAFETATDSVSGDVSFMPPAADDWYAVWDNQAVMNFSQVVDTTVNLYSNNGYIPPVCSLAADRGASDATVLQWETLEGVNLDAYNVYRSTSAADVGKSRTQAELAPYLLGTVPDPTYTDGDVPTAGQAFFYSVRTLGKDGTLADECVY